MMPLVQHIAGIVQTSLRGRDACTLLDVASVSLFCWITPVFLG